MLSPDTVAFLNSILDQVTLSGGDPQLLAYAAAIAKAREELAAAGAPEFAPCRLCGDESRQAVDGLPCVQCTQAAAACPAD